VVKAVLVGSLASSQKEVEIFSERSREPGRWTEHPAEQSDWTARRIQIGPSQAVLDLAERNESLARWNGTSSLGGSAPAVLVLAELAETID
jgi:hypothetical protein